MPNATERKEAVTPPEAARELSVCEDTVRLWIKNKQLRAYNLVEDPQMQPRWRIMREDLEAFLRRRANVVCEPSVKAPRRSATGDYERFDYGG
jgi:excisionase family DNA binding protein